MAYYTLLSIVPMFALILVVLSQVIQPQLLLEITQSYLALVAPGKASALMEQIKIFIDNWKLVGVVGLLVMLFFSSLAFTVLENAMSVIFHHRVSIRRRHFLVSAILPYIYMLLLGLGLLVVSVGRLAWHHALIGGLTAAVLWEITRRLLVWYFSTLSFVNVIYGTLASAVVILLSLEAAALILLLGAQVIAAYERIGLGNDTEGLYT